MIRFSREKVLLLHKLMAEATGGSADIRDEGLLDSALESVFAAGETAVCTVWVCPPISSGISNVVEDVLRGVKLAAADSAVAVRAAGGSCWPGWAAAGCSSGAAVCAGAEAPFASFLAAEAFSRE